ncbi:MAG: alkaline phosphatase family protein [Bacteroidota bacterium]
MSVIFLFIDGIGVGPGGSGNPFDQVIGPGWDALTGDQAMTEASSWIDEQDHQFRTLDARLEVEGLPQSGTGQATLFSGENAPAIIDRHFGPFPHSKTRHLLREQSLFQKVQQLGGDPYFMNGYPDLFFEKMQRRNRWTCTTLMAHSSGQDLNRLEDVQQGRAITAELTQDAWQEHLDLNVPSIHPQQAADRVLQMSEEKDLILVEYYLTDKAGHAQDPDRAQHYLSVLDGFIHQLYEHKSDQDLLVITSDHGNMEDLQLKTHTLHPVPLFAIGKGANQFKSALSLMDVTPRIVDVLRG